MTTDDLAYEAQQLAMHDTIAWDEIYERATAQARGAGFAQLILEHGPADYELIDGSDPTALRADRLIGAKIHVILDWPRLRPRRPAAGLVLKLSNVRT